MACRSCGGWKSYEAQGTTVGAKYEVVHSSGKIIKRYATARAARLHSQGVPGSFVREITETGD